MARTNVRVSALIFRDGKILLIHRFRYGKEYWTVPGGGVEDGEDIETALRREVLEETSLKLLSFTKAFDYTGKIMVNKITAKTDIYPFFICDTVGEPCLGDGPESKNNSADNQYILTWVPMSEFDSLCSLYPIASAEIKQAYFAMQ